MIGFLKSNSKIGKKKPKPPKPIKRTPLKRSRKPITSKHSFKGYVPGGKISGKYGDRIPIHQVSSC